VRREGHSNGGNIYIYVYLYIYIYVYIYVYVYIYIYIYIIYLFIYSSNGGAPLQPKRHYIEIQGGGNGYEPQQQKGDYSEYKEGGPLQQRWAIPTDTQYQGGLQLGLYKILFHIYKKIVGVNHRFIAPPPSAKPTRLQDYCTTIAQYTMPSPAASFVCHTSYTILVKDYLVKANLQRRSATAGFRFTPAKRHYNQTTHASNTTTNSPRE